jgi:hypothetical protein
MHTSLLGGNGGNNINGAFSEKELSDIEVPPPAHLLFSLSQNNSCTNIIDISLLLLPRIYTPNLFLFFFRDKLYTFFYKYIL